MAVAETSKMTDDTTTRNSVGIKKGIERRTSGQAVQTPDLLELLVCPICLDIMHGPATLSCGHSGCLLCLSQTILHLGQCPQCRSRQTDPLSFNTTLSNIIRLVDPASPDPISSRHPLLPIEEVQVLNLRDAVALNDKASLLNFAKVGYNMNSRIFANGNNALGKAAGQNSCELMGVLLDAGGHIDLHDTDGDTPLMNAVYFRCPDMVRFLLKRNANPTLVSETGLTALDYAKRPGACDAPVDESIVRDLEQAMKEWASSHTSAGSDSYEPAPPLLTQSYKPQTHPTADRSTSTNRQKPSPVGGDGIRMAVMISAPMVRAEASPVSLPVGRLKEGDIVVAMAYLEDEESGICYVRFEQGPSACETGWLPYRLPTSNTQVLLEVTALPAAGNATE